MVELHSFWILCRYLQLELFLDCFFLVSSILKASISNNGKKLKKAFLYYFKKQINKDDSNTETDKELKRMKSLKIVQRTII